MHIKIVSQPNQPRVIDGQNSGLNLSDRPIEINFDLWGQLSQPQRDLLILRTVAWAQASRWLKPELYQGGVVLGLMGTLVEFVQGDVLGVMVAAGLSAIAATQIWRNSRGLRVDLAADQNALEVAQRRGYPEAEAAKHLHSAIQAVARLEGRSGLAFNELIRCQNLKAIAGLSAVDIPQTLH
jgi:hypothetical protein